MVGRIRHLLRQGDSALVSFVAVVLSCAATADASSKTPTVSAKEIDSVFAQWNASTPGCAVGVSVNGKTAVSQAYGMADLEHDVKNTVDTVFEAGSVSKQFTAAAVLMLARDGKLSLDDPIRKYIPEVPDYGAPVTIRHMLAHTSGLRDWGDVALLAGWPRGSRFHTDADVLAIVSRQRALNFLPGTQWSYSNSGYNLAEVLVSRVSGQSLAEFTRQRIFVPLGMTHTSWRDDYTRIVKGRAIAYKKAPDGFHSEMPFENIYGQGGLLTTVGDLLKWNAHLSSPGSDASIVTEMERQGHLNNGMPHPYGLGLFIRNYRDVREIAHEGQTAAYTAFLARYPDQQVSLAVLCNTSGGGAAWNPGHAIADLFLGKPAPEQTEQKSSTPAPAPTQDPKALQALAGRYTSDEVGSDAVVSAKDNAIELALGTHMHALLIPKDKDTFADDMLSVTFDRDSTGKPTAFRITTGRVWNLKFSRVP